MLFVTKRVSKKDKNKSYIAIVYSDNNGEVILSFDKITAMKLLNYTFDDMAKIEINEKVVVE